MKRFKTFIAEGKYPVWVRITVAGLVLKIRNLTNRIQKEEDPFKQNQLIAQQNKLISYVSGLGIGVGTNDTSLLKRLKSFKT
jgi:hypothetical protein